MRLCNYSEVIVVMHVQLQCVRYLISNITNFSQPIQLSQHPWVCGMLFIAKISVFFIQINLKHKKRKYITKSSLKDQHTINMHSKIITYCILDVSVSFPVITL